MAPIFAIQDIFCIPACLVDAGCKTSLEARINYNVNTITFLIDFAGSCITPNALPTASIKQCTGSAKATSDGKTAFQIGMPNLHWATPKTGKRGQENEFGAQPTSHNITPFVPTFSVAWCSTSRYSAQPTSHKITPGVVLPGIPPYKHNANRVRRPGVGYHGPWLPCPPSHHGPCCHAPLVTMHLGNHVPWLPCPGVTMFAGLVLVLSGEDANNPTRYVLCDVYVTYM